MLSADRLTLAIDVQSRSYKLLRWVADAIEKGFIAATRAHEYADATESAFDWIDQHYENFPEETRPDRRHLREFANFFSTYVTTSFDVIQQPGTRLESVWMLLSLVFSYCQRTHLQTKKLTKRDKTRAADLMVDRLTLLSLEEGVMLHADDVSKILEDDQSRRSAGYSAYGFWLIQRLEGQSDGKSILALWREIAWHRAGSPIKNFKLQYRDFVDAEESLVSAMRFGLR